MKTPYKRITVPEPKPKHNIRDDAGKFKPVPMDAVDHWLASKKPKA